MLRKAFAAVPQNVLRAFVVRYEATTCCQKPCCPGAVIPGKPACSSIASFRRVVLEDMKFGGSKDFPVVATRRGSRLASTFQMIKKFQKKIGNPGGLFLVSFGGVFSCSIMSPPSMEPKCFSGSMVFHVGKNQNSQTIIEIKPHISDASLADPCEDLRKTKLDILCKVAVITGGGSGIGYAAAYELLNNGAKNVVLAHPDVKKGEKAAACLCAQFGMDKAMYLPCDIRNSKQFEDVFISLRNCSLKVDILLNNAGVLDDKNWEYSLNINVIGTLRGMLLALKYMKGNNSVVINTCATAGLSPWPNCPIFAASKHAIVAASKCFGHPFHYDKTNIRVIGLCPNFTNTPTWEKGVQRHLEKEWGKATLDAISKIKMQSASLVGRAIVHLVKYGKSGKIYVCDQGVLHRAAFPREEDILMPQQLC